MKDKGFKFSVAMLRNTTKKEQLKKAAKEWLVGDINKTIRNMLEEDDR